MDESTLRLQRQHQNFPSFVVKGLGREEISVTAHSAGCFDFYKLSKSQCHLFASLMRGTFPTGTLGEQCVCIKIHQLHQQSCSPTHWAAFSVCKKFPWQDEETVTQISGTNYFAHSHGKHINQQVSVGSGPVCNKLPEPPCTSASTPVSLRRPVSAANNELPPVDCILSCHPSLLTLSWILPCRC